MIDDPIIKIIEALKELDDINQTPGKKYLGGVNITKLLNSVQFKDVSDLQEKVMMLEDGVSRLEETYTDKISFLEDRIKHLEDLLLYNK